MTNLELERASPIVIRSAEGSVSPPAIRLLFVTPRYLPLIGGVENHVYQVARRLAKSGVEVTVLTTDPSGKLQTQEQTDGFLIRRVRAWPAGSDLHFAPGIYRTILESNWDLLHVQSYHTLVAPLAMLAAQRARIPYVVTFHGGGHSSRLRNALRSVQRRALRPLLARADRLIATARFEINFFAAHLSLPKERFVLIPNGAEITNLEQPAGTPPDGALIASVGRLERYKGHHRILSAMPYILKQRPDARLWIAGSGPYEAALQHLAEKLDVAAQVEIRAVPMSEKQTLAAELSRVSLVTLLSEYETHPMAVLEALALGRPVLVADTSGLSELAEQVHARAIPLSSTAEEIAAAVVDQLNRPIAPVKIILPTWDACAANLHHLYHSILRKPLCTS